MKNKKGIKFLIVAFLLAIIIVGIYAGHCYGFFKYGGIYSKGNEFKNVYGAVCKNINIRYQKVQSIAMTDEWISVSIKLHSIPYFLVGIDLDPIDYYSMFSIYDALSNMYPNKKINVGVGAVGSSDSTKEIVNGKLTFFKDCFINDECELDFYEMLSYAMNNSNINAIEINYSNGYQFDLLPNSLSKNETVTYLRGFSAYANDCSVIKSFQEQCRSSHCPSLSPRQHKMCLHR